MSISTQLQRINEAKAKLKAKAIALGIISEEEDIKIDGVADRYDAIVKNVSSAKTLEPNANVEIAAGYYASDFTVTSVVPGDYLGDSVPKYDSGDKDIELSPEKTVAPIEEGYYVGGGNSVRALLNEDDVTFLPEGEKEVNPSRQKQIITGSTIDGKAAFLTKVTVNAIPSELQDVSGVTATSATVLEGSKFVDADGNLLDGQMPSIEGYHHVLTLRDPSFSIPTGYHDGAGIVEVATSESTVTPSETQQVAKSEEGYFLSQVTVEAIPNNYIGSGINRVDDIQDNYNIIEGASQTFNAGYYDKSFTVTATSDTAGDENAFADRTEGNAVADDLAHGKTAWVNGTKITGNVPTYETLEDPSASRTVYVTGSETTSTLTDSFTAGLYREGAKVTVDLSQLEAVLAAI